MVRRKSEKRRRYIESDSPSILPSCEGFNCQAFGALHNPKVEPGVDEQRD
jgi:hypothetical protein